MRQPRLSPHFAMRRVNCNSIQGATLRGGLRLPIANQTCKVARVRPVLARPVLRTFLRHGSGEDNSRNGNRNAAGLRIMLGKYPYRWRCRGDCGSGGRAAFGHDGGVEAFAEFGGKLVDLVFAVDGDSLASGV